ncbi:hypothetical protein K440DRAFT_659036 [Wilcoxina mikolae CBS 423.85]|nr:hypothetical protein K440DRAFT_659036 [Wilcoxina mikolae CBS 423.85]
MPPPTPTSPLSPRIPSRMDVCLPAPRPCTPTSRIRTPSPRHTHTSFVFTKEASPELDYSLSHLVETPGNVKLHWPPPDIERGRRRGESWKDYIMPSTRQDIVFMGVQETELSPKCTAPKSPVFRDLRRRRSKSVPAVMGQHRRDIVDEGKEVFRDVVVGSPKLVKKTRDHAGDSGGSSMGGLLLQLQERSPYGGASAALQTPGDSKSTLKSPVRTHDSSVAVFNEDYGISGKTLDTPTIHTTAPFPAGVDERTSSPVQTGSARRQWSLRMVPPSPAVPATTDASSTAANDCTRNKSKHVSIPPPPSSQKTLQSPLPKTHGPPRFPVRAKSTTFLPASKAPESKHLAPKLSAPRSRSTVAQQPPQDIPTKHHRSRSQHPRENPVGPSKHQPSTASRSRSRPAFSTARAPPSPQRRRHRAITPPSRAFKVIATRPVSVFDRLTVPTVASRARTVSPNTHPTSKKPPHSKHRTETKQQSPPPAPPKTQFQIWEQRGYAAYEAARLIEKCCFMDVQRDDIRGIRREINVVFVEMRGQGRKGEVERGYRKVAELLRKVVWVMDGEEEEDVVEELIRKVLGEVEV